MRLSDKDIELADAYFEGRLSEEEMAFFRIKMQDEDFEGFVKFQQKLREEIEAQTAISAPTLTAKPKIKNNLQLDRSQTAHNVSKELGSTMWYVLVASLVLVALLTSIFIR